MGIHVFGIGDGDYNRNRVPDASHTISGAAILGFARFSGHVFRTAINSMDQALVIEQVIRSNIKETIRCPSIRALQRQN